VFQLWLCSGLLPVDTVGNQARLLAEARKGNGASATRRATNTKHKRSGGRLKSGSSKRG
jgi:hypothetical protein